MSAESKTAPASGLFDGGEHLFPLRVYFEDTDLSGLVYHANYLRFMERARSDMLRLIGIDQRGTLARGEGVYAIADLEMRYRSPAYLEDELLVRSQVLRVTPARCVIAQTVCRGNVILTEGRVTVAFLDPSGRPRRQPADWLTRFSPYIMKDPATA